MDMDHQDLNYTHRGQVCFMLQQQVGPNAVNKGRSQNRRLVEGEKQPYSEKWVGYCEKRRGTREEGKKSPQYKKNNGRVSTVCMGREKGKMFIKFQSC